jgi:sugar transferase (PEP-CTERM system associated)
MNTLRIFNHYVHAKYLGLSVCQLVLLLASAFVAVHLRFFGKEVPLTTVPGLFWSKALVFALAIMVSMYAMGIYQPRRRDGHLQVILRVLIGFVLATLLLGILFYLWPPLYLGRGILGLALGLALIGSLLIQLAFYWIVDQHIAPWRVLFYGAGENAASILAFLRRRSDRRLFKLIGCVEAAGETARVDPKLVRRDISRLVDYARAHRIDEIVVAMDDLRCQFPADELMACRFAGINVVDTLTFYERQTGKIKTELLRPSWIIFSYGFRATPVQDTLKRLMDLSAAIVLLLVTWPLMLVTALAIVLEDGRPVFFRQRRVGLGGAEFSIVKFRSMGVDAEAGGAQWAVTNDPRVTRVGRFIRKTRLDELPQLFNVLSGEMSLVGPRPERPEFVAELIKKLPYYQVREQVKPGITGWAQVGYPYGASEEDANGKLQLDLYYVKNRSLFLDLLILLGTTEVVLMRRGGR